MLTVANPSRWARTINASHTVATRVEVWNGGTQVVADLPVAGGEVVRDLGAKVSMTASVEVADPSYLPVAQTDPLAPLGNHLKIFTGLKYPDGTEDLPQVFEGPIVSAPTWPGNNESFTIKAEGWMRYVLDDRFIEPYAPADAASATTELTNLLQGAVPGATVTVDPAISDVSLSGGRVWEKEREKAVEALADILGALVTDLPTGGFSIAPDPAPDGNATPVREYHHGEQGAILEGSSPELERSTRYNGVLAYNPDDGAVRHLATIADAGSPVQWGGPFGKRVYYFASPLLVSATVQAAAESRLASLAGRMRIVDVSVLPDPSLEPGDHVLIAWPSRYSEPMGEPWTEKLIVRSVKHPLGPGPTVLELRGLGVSSG